MKSYVSKLLSEHLKQEITFAGKRLSWHFSKDKINLEHQHYYVGEIGRRIVEIIKDHSGRDQGLNVVKHNIKNFYTSVHTVDFIINDMNFSNNKIKWKNTAYLWVKDMRATLNVQKR